MKQTEPQSSSGTQSQTQTQTQTQPQSQSQSQTEAGSQPPLNLQSLPPIFVLPTHLSLDALHQIEDHLVRGAAHLTYDISEAGVVLGRLSHSKRVALELRARGVWTEEVPASHSSVSPAGRWKGEEPPAKRARVSEGARIDGLSRDDTPNMTGPSNEAIDLDTETESEEDGMEGHRGEKHLQRPELVSAVPSKETARAEPNVIQVVKLSWLDECIAANSLLPIDSYLLYKARKVARPAGAEARSPPITKPTSILQRVRQDASTPSSHPPPPPKLHRTTTSEAEEDNKTSLPPPPDWVVNRLPYACQRRSPLHPPNEAFIQQLLKIRQIRQLTLDEIGVRAYSTSIAAIAAYPYKFRRASEILSLPGCDAKIAHLFSEYQSSPNGSLEAASQLDKDPTLRTLHTFNQIWGVGAKTAREFYYTRQWRDLDDIILHGWAGLSRVQQIGVKYYDEFLRGMSRSQVETIASTVQRHAHKMRPHAHYDGVGVECIIVGGYRRGKETCGDVDVILTHRDESVTQDLIVDVVGSLESEHYITHTLHLNLSTSDRDQQSLPYRGDAIEGARHFDSLDKALVVWQDPLPTSPTESPTKDRKKNTNTHHRVDIIVSHWRSIGCAVLGWTGDTTFERDLRRIAKKRHNWKFDSSGVRERDGKGRVLDLEAKGRTWEEREKLAFEGIVGSGMWIGPEGRCSF
ncbi:terminal deoxynucleotidyl transferase [Aspergillus affinis]|uniref:terminal deoxynucleotidyl transferase n=1 Tax=Aspergillus affinis TaxID=1070780 RepID=UPI0022FE30DC|nr:terminal deoxynucleotidyl transferase [Aspergillus affinis]KAI9038016.1 terminal deoxynucleotidyl transferase [Aspergillus affinis]